MSEDRESLTRESVVRTVEDLLFLRNTILARAAIQTGTKVIDIGAGRGFLAAGAERMGAEVIALDIDHDGLRDGIASNPVAGDARLLPFRDESFDRAVMRSALIWMEDRARALSEVLRVLVPGGLIAGSESLNGDFEVTSRHRGLGEIWSVLREAIRSEAAPTLTAEELRSLLTQADFFEVEMVVEETVESEWDPTEFFFERRGPGGFSIAEFLVSGGFDEKLITGFVNGLASEGAGLVTHEGIFSAQKNLEGS